MGTGGKEERTGGGRCTGGKEERTGRGRCRGGEEERTGGGKCRGGKEERTGGGECTGGKEKRTGGGRCTGGKEERTGGGRCKEEVPWQWQCLHGQRVLSRLCGEQRLDFPLPRRGQYLCWLREHGSSVSGADDKDGASFQK